MVTFQAGYLDVASLGCAGRAGRRGDPAVRLARAGDVRRADRGGDGASPGDRHGVRSRRRAAGLGRRRSSSTTTTPRAMAAAIRQVLCEPAQAASMVSARRRACAGPPVAAPSPPATAPSPTTSSRPTLAAVDVNQPRGLLRARAAGSPTTSASSSTPKARSPGVTSATASTTSPGPWSWWPEQPEPTPRSASSTHRYLDFVAARRPEDGRCHNRLGLDRRWKDEAGVEDCWGRALVGPGNRPPRRSIDAGIRQRAADRFALERPVAVRPSPGDGLRRAGRRRDPHCRTRTTQPRGAAGRRRPRRSDAGDRQCARGRGRNRA